MLWAMENTSILFACKRIPTISAKKAVPDWGGL